MFAHDLYHFIGFPDLDTKHATSPLDNIFHFTPMKMSGGDLLFYDKHYFLGVGFLVIGIVIVAISNRK